MILGSSSNQGANEFDFVLYIIDTEVPTEPNSMALGRDIEYTESARGVCAAPAKSLLRLRSQLDHPSTRSVTVGWRLFFVVVWHSGYDWRLRFDDGD